MKAESKVEGLPMGSGSKMLHYGSIIRIGGDDGDFGDFDGDTGSNKGDAEPEESQGDSGDLGRGGVSGLQSPVDAAYCPVIPCGSPSNG